MRDLSDRHPATQQLARWFEYQHLSPMLSAISSPFAALADEMIGKLPDGPELSASLRKLLEAKDCAVRAKIAAAEADF